MSSRDRSGYIATVIFVALLIVLVPLAIWDMSVEYTHQSIQADYSTRQHRDSAQQRIQSTCISMDPRREAECVEEAVKASENARRANADLAAQEHMSLWAGWAIGLSVTLPVTLNARNGISSALGAPKAFRASAAGFQVMQAPYRQCLLYLGSGPINSDAVEWRQSECFGRTSGHHRSPDIFCQRHGPNAKKVPFVEFTLRSGFTAVSMLDSPMLV